MDRAFRNELNFALLVAVLVGTYFAIVGSYAVAHAGFEVLAIASLNSAMLAVFSVSFGVVLLGYTLRRAIELWKHDTQTSIVADIRQHILRPDRLIARATILAGWFCMMWAFSPFKEMIGHNRGFSWDPLLAKADRILFFNFDGWQTTHALFGWPAATAFLQLCYTIWFIMVWSSIVYCIVRSDEVRLRMHFLLAFLLVWMLIGSLAAYFLASAGPCFYDNLFGGTHFKPLSDHLHDLDAKIAAAVPSLRIVSLDMQAWLWQSFVDRAANFGAGISAMPSVHVAFAALMARAAFGIGKRMGWTLMAYAIFIWIASVHLGWHYAIDGIVGAAMALAIWYASGMVVARLLAATDEEPAEELPVPATA